MGVDSLESEKQQHVMKVKGGGRNETSDRNRGALWDKRDPDNYSGITSDPFRTPHITWVFVSLTNKLQRRGGISGCLTIYTSY